MKGLTHEHDVGDKGAHIDDEKVLVQDTGDDAVQKPGFYGNAPRGIALLVPFLTMPGRPAFLLAIDQG